MFGLNRYSNVLLYFRNRCYFLRYWKESLRCLCRRQSSQTFGSIRSCHFYFLDSKIVFWSIIRRLYQTKWWNREWLLGVHEKNPTNYLFETFMALVPSSTIHWYHAYLSPFKMVYQTCQEQQIPTEKFTCFHQSVSSPSWCSVSTSSNYWSTDRTVKDITTL